MPQAPEGGLSLSTHQFVPVESPPTAHFQVSPNYTPTLMYGSPRVLIGPHRYTPKPSQAGSHLRPSGLGTGTNRCGRPPGSPGSLWERTQCKGAGARPSGSSGRTGYPGGHSREHHPLLRIPPPRPSYPRQRSAPPPPGTRAHAHTHTGVHVSTLTFRSHMGHPWTLLCGEVTPGGLPSQTGKITYPSTWGSGFHPDHPPADLRTRTQRSFIPLTLGEGGEKAWGLLSASVSSLPLHTLIDAIVSEHLGA